MRELTILLFVVASLGALATSAQAQSVLSICDYTSPESRVVSLSLQGNFQWYDGPYLDDRARVVSLATSADYSLLYASETVGHQLDVTASLRGDQSSWSFTLSGDGDLKSFWRGDAFGLAAFGVDASDGSLEVDLTAGLGTGRFRDVTPLAKAIQIQNDLLDLGILLAPLENGPLLALAQTIGEAGSTQDEKTSALAAQLVATDLVKDNELGVRGLLAIEQIIASTEGGRVCGRDVQGRIGLSATMMPTVSIATTGVLLFNYALAPDPVSQLTSNASCKVHLAHPDELSAELDLSYSRRLPEGWTARSTYRLTYDHRWTHPDQTQVGHVLTASLTTQVLGSVGLSLAGELRHFTGDEEITSLLTIHLTYDIF